MGWQSRAGLVGWSRAPGLLALSDEWSAIVTADAIEHLALAGSKVQNTLRRFSDQQGIGKAGAP